MANLTQEEATELVNGGTILRRLTDGAYSFHKFSGNLNGAYYECATPLQHDLGLEETTSKADAEAAFIAHFQTEECKASEPVNEDSTDW
jgi:hypothetical protein